MKIVFAVKSGNKQKAEDVLKQDDEINRGSITIRAASSLDINEDCYFIILDATHESVEKAKHLLKEIAELYKHPEKVIEKVEEQENSAIEGFGNVLG